MESTATKQGYEPLDPLAREYARHDPDGDAQWAAVCALDDYAAVVKAACFALSALDCRESVNAAARITSTDAEVVKGVGVALAFVAAGLEGAATDVSNGFGADSASL